MEYESLPRYDGPPPDDPSDPANWPGGCRAFTLGGCGCLLAFAGCAAVAVVAGGRAWIDPGGAVCLFVVGGCLGVLVRAVYNKGWRDATRGPGP